MKQILLASNNKNKLKEFKELFSEFGYDVISQAEAGIHMEAEENADSFAGNAFIKANAACELSGLPAVADDSGLVVDALNGEPGIYSARYGGKLASTDIERYQYLLKKLGSEEKRSARFVCSICCVFPNGDVLHAEDSCEGDILFEPHGDNGFGYDPVFRPAGYDCSMAELESAEKNSISHRGKAARKFITEFSRYINDYE